MDITLNHYLFLGAIIFTIGVIVIFLNKKNVIIILMSIELILLSVNINLVAFSTYLGNLSGQIFAMFTLTVAAAEAAIGLAILVAFFGNLGSIEVQKINKLKALNFFRNNEKETKEHNMIVDLERNDLSKVCKPGTVKIQKEKYVEEYKHLYHYVTSIVGKLNKNISVKEIITAMMPGGSVIGLSLIHISEPTRPY